MPSGQKETWCGFTCYASGRQYLESAERDSQSAKARYCLSTDQLLEDGDFYSPHRTRLAQHTDTNDCLPDEPSRTRSRRRRPDPQCPGPRSPGHPAHLQLHSAVHAHMTSTTEACGASSPASPHRRHSPILHILLERKSNVQTDFPPNPNQIKDAAMGEQQPPPH